LVAVTVNVKLTPLVKPVKVIGETALEDEIPVFDVAVKLVIVAGIPRYAGAVKGTLAVVFPDVTVPIVGASGTIFQVPSDIACICCVLVQIPEKLGIIFPLI
jgi:hypothetical protein